MLTAEVVAGMDPAQLLNLALEQDQRRREALRFGADLPAGSWSGIRAAVAEIEAEAEALALASFDIDCERHRLFSDPPPPPTAPVVRLVVSNGTDPVRPAPRLGTLDRLRAALGRSAAAQVA